MHSTNERQHYIVTSSLIGLAHTQNDHIHGLAFAQKCSDSIGNALELLHYCTKPSIYVYMYIYKPYVFMCYIALSLLHICNEALPS